MLQFFRSNQLYAGLLLIFYILLLRLAAWWQPIDLLAAPDLKAGVLGQLLLQWATDRPAANILLGSLVIFATALVANQLVAKERLGRSTNQFPGLFFILLSSLFPALLGLHSIALANFFLLLSLWSSFGLYQKAATAKIAFNAGFWLGVAALFNSTFSVYLILVFLSGAILNTLNFRLLLRFVLGWLSVIWLTAFCYFMQDQLPYFLETQRLKLYRPQFELADIWNFGGIVTLSAVLGFVIFKQPKNVNMLHIEGRKKVAIIYWWLLLTAFLLLLYPTTDTSQAQLLLLPLGILLSFSFSRASQSAAEAGHLLLYLLAWVFNALPFFTPT